MTALLVALLGSLAGPGAALAHGMAHEREHHRAQHGAAAHHVHATADGQPHAHVHPREVLGFSERVSDHAHGHATLDSPVRPRGDVAVTLPFVAPATPMALLATRALGHATVPHAALARPQPDAVPPPRTRAPPRR